MSIQCGETTYFGQHHWRNGIRFEHSWYILRLRMIQTGGSRWNARIVEENIQSIVFDNGWHLIHQIAETVIVGHVCDLLSRNKNIILHSPNQINSIAPFHSSDLNFLIHTKL